jgi:hypothetical protein
MVIAQTYDGSQQLLRYQQPGYIVTLGATPIQQTWNVTMPTDLNTQWQIKDIFGFVIKSGNHVNMLNSLKGVTNGALNAIVAAIVNPAMESSRYNVTSSQVTNAHWVNQNGKVALAYDLTTISDPIDVTGVVAIIAGLILILGATIISSAIISAIASAGVLLPPSILAAITAATFIAGLILVIAGAWSVIQSSGGIGGLLTGNTSGILNDVVAIAAIGLVGIGAVLYFTRK